jgi:hypothetical protein
MKKSRSAPILRRDDPAKGPLIGNVKVTPQEYLLNVAMDVLVSDGVERLKP